MPRIAVLGAAVLAVLVHTPCPGAAQTTPPEKIAAARKLIVAGSVDSATALLHEVADSPSTAGPQDRAAAFVWLGIAAFYRGDDSTTARSFRAALAIDPSTDAANLSGIDTLLAAAWQREQVRSGNPYPLYSSPPAPPPTVVRAPRLRYPDSLRQAGIQGRVYAQVIIDTAGGVVPGSIRIIATPSRGFDDAVREWIGQAKFAPGKVAGRAVNTQATLPIDFQLPDQEGAASASTKPAQPTESPVHDCVHQCKGGESAPRLISLPQMHFENRGTLGPSGSHGHVVVQGVVDQAGRLDLGTISLITSNASEFERAVREVLPALQFRPARLFGVPVAVRIELRFDIRPEGAGMVRYGVETP